ncbi:glycine cleavage system protein GcvH [Pseudonocardia spinosispora]|uniref:glycine cleavage system protein GcvH n=1 Tax=Pseudonocardia spinosispora TaxID=103441 RepID=UPI0003FC4201|nr:glycine cleavage system protein GcvH [Pseudonocardia spinosispora]
MTAAHELPPNLSYTRDHEWIAVAPGADLPEDAVRIGLSAIAAESLGEIVFVDLPEAGTTLVAGEACGEVESTKSVSDLISPAGGTVVELNPALADDPALVGKDPYGEGWLFTAVVTDLGDVLSADDYLTFTQGT